MKYQALKKRRGHKKALIAVARKMLSILYTLLSNGDFYDPAVTEVSLCDPSDGFTQEQQLQIMAKKIGYEIVKVQDPVPAV